MPKNDKIKIWLSKVFFESFLIVISILAALAIDSWNQQRENQELVIRSITAIKKEVEQSHRWMQENQPYHRGILTVITEQSQEQNIPSANEFRMMLDGMDAFVTRTSAWETLVDTGVLNYMDFELVSALSLTYGLQRRFEKIYNDGLRELLNSSFTLENNPKAIMYSTRRYLTEINNAEEELLAAYIQISELLESHTENYE